VTREIERTARSSPVRRKTSSTGFRTTLISPRGGGASARPLPQAGSRAIGSRAAEKAIAVERLGEVRVGSLLRG